MARASDATGGDIVLAQSSSQLDDLKNALTSSQVTGWDILGALTVMVVSIPVSVLIGRLASRLLRRVPNLPDEFVQAGGRVSRWLVYLIASAWALSLLGVTVDWIVVVVAVVVIIVVLMARPMVENGAAGLLLTMRPAFGEGDEIETAGYRGDVAAIGSRSTILSLTDGRQVHIPNSQVLGAPIIVYTASESRKAALDITLGFETDLDKATEVLMRAVSGVDGVQQDPAPGVQASAFAHNTITLTVNYWYPSSMSSASPVTDGVIRACRDALVAADISPTVPTLDVEKEPATASDHGSEVGEPPVSTKPDSSTT
jgi:small-conductance mechanosensitive channel